MSRNLESMDCRRVEVPAASTVGDGWVGCREVLERPGDFFWRRDDAGVVTDLIIWLPGNEGGSIAPIAVCAGPFKGHGQPTWGWDGNEEKPSLEPSIWRNQPSKNLDGSIREHRNEWHGNLKAGRLESA